MARSKFNLLIFICPVLITAFLYLGFPWFETQLAKFKALTTNNPYICSQIKSDKQKNQCYLNIFKKLTSDSICKEVGEAYYKDMCFGTVAVNTGSKDSCARVVDVQSSIVCLAKLSVKFNGPSYCTSVSDENLRQLCIQLTKDSMNVTPEK